MKQIKKHTPDDNIKNFKEHAEERFHRRNDKEGYAKASGKPVLFMMIGIAVSGVVAVVTSKIIISVVIIVGVAVIMGIWFSNIQNRFS